jgi:Fe-S cluster biosynthesis and repair protein YggX
MCETWKCQKCDRTGPRLERPPYPGELGQEITETICKVCWPDWLRVQMMVINEYRVNLADKKGMQIVEDQMRQFLFGAGSLPEGYVPPAPRK